jgi:Mn2+/Fe2+ NRAMP family transporter
MKGALIASLKILSVVLFFALWLMISLFWPKQRKGH